MTYIDILNDEIQVECILIGNKYNYYLKEGDSKVNIGVHTKSPLELSQSSQIGRVIFKKLDDNLTNREKKEIDVDTRFRIILQDLEGDVRQQAMENEKETRTALEDLEEKYEEYYGRFMSNCRIHNFTPLQYIIRVFEGLGVNAQLEMFKVFSGYLQTFLGLKGTNVIGLGGQSSGKTHCLENPLDCIPDEFVHRGTFTKSSFFEMYEGMDLTGHIFYLGDLGGDTDDENTINSRNVLKQLSTDGFIARSLTEGKGDDKEAVTQIVTGTPAIAYTTVVETMINEQERSRSVIIRPPDVDQRRIMVFDSFCEAPGELWELQETIEEDKKSICGFVWWLKKEITSIELFNPFMFCVQKYLSKMEDFNRKIKEFNMALKIVCILNDSYALSHRIYCDFTKEKVEDMEITTKLYIPSKQDVIDALHLFEGATGLLPSEIALTKGLLKTYTEFPYTDIPVNSGLDEDSSFEEIVRYAAIEDKETYVIEQYTDDNTGATYLYDYDTAIQGVDGEDIYCFFTIDDVRKGNTSQRWYREVKEELSAKLDKLCVFGVLIKLGKTKNGRNVYGIGEDIENKITNVNPIFTKKDVEDAITIFHEKYPELIEEFDKFVNEQRLKPIKKTNFDIKDKHLYDLQWNHIDA